MYRAILWKEMKSRQTSGIHSDFIYPPLSKKKKIHCNHYSPSACSNFWDFLLLRLKSALLLFFKDMQMFSLSVFYLHSNKPGLLNALGRIKVEVCFECIQRGWWLELGKGKDGNPSPCPCAHYCTLLHLAPIRFSVPFLLLMPRLAGSTLN